MHVRPCARVRASARVGYAQRGACHASARECDSVRSYEFDECMHMCKRSLQHSRARAQKKKGKVLRHVATRGHSFLGDYLTIPHGDETHRKMSLRSHVGASCMHANHTWCAHGSESN
eukprot:6186275-Pleurochrysis_carterae.AAC.4